MNEFGMHFKNITPLIGACVLWVLLQLEGRLYTIQEIQLGRCNKCLSSESPCYLQVIQELLLVFLLCFLQTSSFKHSSHIFDCMLAIHLYSSVCSQLYFRSPFPRLRGRRVRLLYDLFARKHLISDTTVEKAESAAFRDRGRGRWGQRERSSGDRPQNVEPLPDLITTGGHVNNKTWWKQEQKSAAGCVNRAYKRI